MPSPADKQSTAPERRLVAFWEGLTIAAFVGLLWLPTMDHFFKLDHARPPSENRALAKAPQFRGLHRSREFVAGLENYFNDHFGFRKRLIRWNTHWKQQLFRDPDPKEVLLGRDGWLYYSGERMVDHCLRRVSWSIPELENWRRLLEQRRDWLRARGIQYLFVVAPDKQSIYPEYLPDWLTPGTNASKVRQLTEYMHAHSTVAVLDLSETLLEAKRRRTAFLKTDTHWNPFGAFMACEAVVGELARQMPGLTRLPAEAYTWKQTFGPGGDLARVLGWPEHYPETESMTPVPQGPAVLLEALYDPKRLPDSRPKPFCPCYTLNEKAWRKALLFRDSFATAWVPFLGQHFHEVIYLWQRDWDRPLIEREKPEVVVDEFVERIFNLQNPSDLMRADELSVTGRGQTGR